MIKVFLLPFLGLFFSGVLLAQEIVAEKKEKDEIEYEPSGTLASTGGNATGQSSRPLPWGGLNLQNDKSSPIQAKIIQGESRWKYEVSNSSEDRYTANLELVQLNKEGKKIKSALQSVSVPAGKSVTREFAVTPNTVSVDLKMSSWKKITKQRTAEELKAEIDKRKVEIKELELELAGGSKK